MSALPDLRTHFHALERLVEAQPAGVTAEIAAGVYAMTPRPRAAHSAAQAALGDLLRSALGRRTPAGEAPEWLFLVEPELRSERASTRVVPDLAAWRRSTTGWPGRDESLIERMPDWVGEVLSPATEAFDRGPKRDGYGMAGVGWRWLVDPDRRRVEVFTNVRGTMLAGPVFEGGTAVEAPPFEGARFSLDDLFVV